MCLASWGCTVTMCDPGTCKKQGPKPCRQLACEDFLGNLGGR